MGDGGWRLGLGQAQALADPDEIDIRDMVQLLQGLDAGPVASGDDVQGLAGLHGMRVDIQGRILAAEMVGCAIRQTQPVAAGDEAPAPTDRPAQGGIELNQPLG